MLAGNNKDALNLLEKSLATNKQLCGDDSVSNCQILVTLAQVLGKTKKEEAALEHLNEAVSIYERNGCEKGDQLATILLEAAAIYAKIKMTDKAIEY